MQCLNLKDTLWLTMNQLVDRRLVTKILSNRKKYNMMTTRNNRKMGGLFTLLLDCYVFSDCFSLKMTMHILLSSAMNYEV